ncbi:hypothetical protein REPUB_Repub10bG0022000 [Reevesia pubescens]
MSRNLQGASLSERQEQWSAQYGGVYKNNTEKQMRFEILKSNVEFIESFNAAGNRGYKLSINEFADLTNEEFRSYKNGYRRLTLRKETSFRYENVTALPVSIDWRKKRADAPIKDEAQCELIDCDKGEDHGSVGGEMEYAFEFIIRNHGIALEATYRYKGYDGICSTTLKEASYAAATITSYQIVPANNEQALRKAVANQPVSVSIDDGGFAFRFYSSGIFTGDCGTELDHAVTAVGYGTFKDGSKYWLMKNSWGR